MIEREEDKADILALLEQGANHIDMALRLGIDLKLIQKICDELVVEGKLEKI